MRSSFATVPLYRELWALRGGGEPGAVGGITVDEAVRKLGDLVPLAGGDEGLNPLRGFGSVLRLVRRLSAGAFVAVLETGGGEPDELPRRVRCRVVDPRAIATEAEPALVEITEALRRNKTVLLVGADRDLTTLAEAMPHDAAARLDRVPARGIGELDGGRSGVIRDPALGYLGALGGCGRWHLDWQRVYARRTDAGLAFTLLRQRSPRLVDVLVPGGRHMDLAPCPVHRTPVLL